MLLLFLNKIYNIYFYKKTAVTCGNMLYMLLQFFEKSIHTIFIKNSSNMWYCVEII